MSERDDLERLLDERDHYENVAQKHVNRTQAAEQRVAALEEGLRAIASYQIGDELEGDPAVFDWFRSCVRKARSLLSEADATTSVKAQPSLSERSDLSSSRGQG